MGPIKKSFANSAIIAVVLVGLSSTLHAALPEVIVGAVIIFFVALAIQLFVFREEVRDYWNRRKEARRQSS
jgi:uncharacterized membrane protein